jgi:hypothetical protein
MDKKEIKLQIIKEYLVGSTTTRKLGLKYGFSYSFVAQMVRDYMKEQDKDKLKLLLASKLSIKEAENVPMTESELREALRLSRIQVSLLEAMIDISDEQFGTDIRKKAGTRPS